MDLKSVLHITHREMPLAGASRCCRLQTAKRLCSWLRLRLRVINCFSSLRLFGWDFGHLGRNAGIPKRRLSLTPRERGEAISADRMEEGAQPAWTWLIPLWNLRDTGFGTTLMAQKCSHYLPPAQNNQSPDSKRHAEEPTRPNRYNGQNGR